MNPNQKINTISFTMQGQIPLHKDWIAIERNEMNQFVLVPTEKISMWEHQFAQVFRKLYKKRFDGDAKISVVLYTKKDSDSVRLSHTILKVVEKYCIKGRVRDWNIRQELVDTLLEVRSEFTIIVQS